MDASTAQYVYNALNQRVRTVVGSTALEFVFNAAGQRVSVWDGTAHTQLRGQYYWGSKPVAYYAASAAHFQHQDWLGTERQRTTYNGAVEGSFTSLPFGDAKSASGTDGDAYHFAVLDNDSETSTDHAQYRQYSNAQGRWLRPDPYSGSYRFGDPQSFNRYVYASNRPLSSTDSLGLDDSNPCDTGTPVAAVVSGMRGVHSQDVVPCDTGGDGDTGGGGLDPPPGPPEIIDGQANCDDGGCTSPPEQVEVVADPDAPVEPAPDSVINSFIELVDFAPNNGQQKSRARQQCEANAAAQFQQGVNEIKAALPSNLKTAAGEGFVGGLIGGCAAGAFTMSWGGPATGFAGCVAGGVDGALWGLFTAPIISFGHSTLEALGLQIAYNNQINSVCSKL